MTRFRITYRDRFDDGLGGDAPHCLFVSADDEETAEDAAWDRLDPDEGDWELLEIQRVRRDRGAR